MGNGDKKAFGIAALLSLLLVGLFPGDIPFVNDEPRLLEKAWEAREQGRWWILGLESFSGISYGPLPLLIYRLLWDVTSQLWLWVLTKAVVCQSVLVLSLWFGIRRGGIHRWVAILVLFSPYFYLYQRALWDNVFLVPLAMIAAASTIAFLRSPSVGAYALLVGSGVAMIHVHLMCLLLLTPIGLGLFWHRRKELIRPALLAVSLLGLLVLIPYGGDVISAPRGGGYQGKVGIFEALGAAITAARVLSFPEFFTYFLPDAWALGFSSWLLRLGVFFFTIVIGVAGWGVWVSWRDRRTGHQWQQQWETIAQGVLITVFLVHWFQRIKFHPHYANATWPVYLWFLSRGWKDLLARRPSLAPVLQGAAALQITLVVLMVFAIHLNGGNRLPHYGATLSNQIQVATALGKTKPQRVDVQNYQLFPHSLEFLQKHFGGETSQADWVRYRGDGSGWIEAERLDE